MNKKDIGRIKRRLNLEKHNITCIRACYVNGQGDIISSFTRSLQGMNQEEGEKYLSLFKKVLSGNEGQNLLDMDFTPEQVMESQEHQLLSALRDSALRDEDIVQYFFQQVCASFHPEDHYLILMLHDGYDLPPAQQEEGNAADEISTEVFHYILCAICPVKLTRPSLCYDAAQNAFRSKEADWVVGPPDVGFLFPAFEERAANIYRCLYYTRDTAVHQEDLIATLFNIPLPMPADTQKEMFQSILQDTLQEDCSYEVLQAVHDQVLEKMEEHKAEKIQEPLTINKWEVTDVLKECGVPEEKAQAFQEKYDEHFGSQAQLSAAAVIPPRQFQLRTPNVVIRVSPDRSDLVETRIIDGHPYILIRAEEGVEVNGVNVNITQ